MSQKGLQRLGEQAFSRMEKVNAELFTLTYGALVAQLVRDYEGADEVSLQLEKMGFNIGQRLVDEFLAKSGASACLDFPETAERIARVGFKMFLGVQGTVSDWNEEKTEFSLTIADNPLNDFVELPEDLKGLKYSNLLCGVLRGALEMVNMRVKCTLVKSVLTGDDADVIRVILEEVLTDTYVADDE